jgi:formamidopyrimidine-DNA glycosylase
VPELPEIETIRRQLAPALEGRTLERLEVLDPRWCDPAPPEALADAVDGRLIESLGRRGKYLIVSLEGDVHLVMHLRMTGNLLLLSSEDPEPPYVRVRFTLAPPGAGERLLFVDVRRFGTGDVLLGSDALAEYFASRLGVEPLSPDFTAEALRALARGRRAPVKAFLLTQERIAGVGNIYADEALFGARIHPLRPVGSLKRGQIEALREAVIATLEAGIEAKGASIDDFRHTDGARGSFQDRFLVYDREGEPCPRCGTPIKKLRAAGRGTYVCERCQPRPRVRRA